MPTIPSHLHCFQEAFTNIFIPITFVQTKTLRQATDWFRYCSAVKLDTVQMLVVLLDIVQMLVVLLDTVQMIVVLLDTVQMLVVLLDTVQMLVVLLDTVQMLVVFRRKERTFQTKAVNSLTHKHTPHVYTSIVTNSLLAFEKRGCEWPRQFGFMTHIEIKLAWQFL